jgi:cytochrome P450
MLSDLYITKNKFFDKHDKFNRYFKPLMGETIIT